MKKAKRILHFLIALLIVGQNSLVTYAIQSDGGLELTNELVQPKLPATGEEPSTPKATAKVLPSTGERVYFYLTIIGIIAVILVLFLFFFRNKKEKEEGLDEEVLDE
ncbi:MAG: LPXTG cell wall anchor domain-containing protein [Lactobacillales bacterium]|jgi:LPXTG-motif cell wall-anchored protein|nr:LPXTG cell wall anchor domain-containing protein [Lactobacillales bacterium]